MKSRWTSDGVRGAVDRWGGVWAQAFAERMYTARLLGADPALVLHGGGNVSVKRPIQTILGDEVSAIHVKASGSNLAEIEPDSFPALTLKPLQRLRALPSLDDEAMVNQFRTSLIDAFAPTPSIETLVHAFLPHCFVDHTHADAVLAVANHANGRQLAAEAIGDAVAVLDYVRPGFELAKAVGDCIDNHPKIEGIVLLNHGLITFGDDARTAYERHIKLVDACERFLERHRRGHALTASFRSNDRPADLITRAAPILRGLLARNTNHPDRTPERFILDWRASESVLQTVNSREARSLMEGGPLTGDHVIRTGAHPLFVEVPFRSDADALRRQLASAVESYHRDRVASAREQGETAADLDVRPRVVILPGAGVLAWGPTKREARIAADITVHTLVAKTAARAIGPYAGLSPSHLHDMEFRNLQRSKLQGPSDQPLAGQVVVISGGAGAIGSSTAMVCAEAGAHVAVCDLDQTRLQSVVDRIEARCGCGTAFGIVMDVTDESAVQSGLAEVVRTFGGIDVVVPNAGIAHVASIEALTVSDFRRVMEVNATGYLLLMREGARILKQQGLGGHIIVNASKNVFAPGKDFGAYSASKAAGHQLGKVAAIELAPFGIRVNMINADAVFGEEGNPSGLWSTVGPERARGRNLEPEDLAEYYRNRNLLKTRVCGRHVGNAVVFFASNATPTTGATLPVDGGIQEAFPR